MDPRLRRLLVAILVVGAALWLGSRDIDAEPTPDVGARPPALVATT